MKKIVFLNVAWMRHYRGLTNDDMKGGGSFVQEKGYGHEMFNFLPFKGWMFGYVQPIDTINIQRLGASEKDDSVDDVLAVWVAKKPSGGVYITGWYKRATIYRERQEPPKNSNRKFKGEEFGYFVKAKEQNYELLANDKRIFHIPRGKGYMGQSNVWYADQNSHESFKKKVLDFIEHGKIQHILNQSKNTSGKPRQTDPLRRVKIEKTAIEKVAKHYERMGYEVDSVESENVGWDLDAVLGAQTLKLEVKGLSQEQIMGELTPNEFGKMNQNIDSYRVCFVTNALSRYPQLTIYSFSPERDKWEDDEGNELKIVPIKRVSARLSG